MSKFETLEEIQQPSANTWADKALLETQETRGDSQPKQPTQTRESKAIEAALSSHATSFSLRPWDLNTTDYQQLSKATDLRKLTLNYTQMRDEDLQHIGKLTRLEELDLSDSGIGGGLTHLSSLKELRRLNVADCFFIKDDQIQQLKQLPKLEHLDVTRSGLTDAGCRTLAEMPQLKSVIMCRTDVTDAGIRALGGLKLESIGLGNKISDAGLAQIPATVKSVEIDQNSRADAVSKYFAQKTGDGPGITSVGIERLATTHPHLESLSICCGPASTDDAMSGVGRMKNLKSLSFVGDVTDKGVAHIGSLEKLEDLFLSGHKFTNEGAKALLACQNLKELGLAGNGINDGVIPTLAKMQNLKSLSLDSTRVSDKGIEQLRKLLPNCKVHDIRSRIGGGNRY
jgi:internalin A